MTVEDPEPVPANEAGEARLVVAARIGAADAALAAERAANGDAVHIEVDEEEEDWEVRIARGSIQETIQIDMRSGRISRGR